jgi:hypothetical protein
MEFLSIIDFFSQTPTLKINKSDKYYTTFGLIISLISIMFITGSGFYFSFICFYKINYQILERLDNTLVPSFKISENKIMITLIDPLGNEFAEHDRLYDIEAKFWKIYPSSENVTKPYIDVPVINLNLDKNETFYDELKKVTRYSTKSLDFSKLDNNLFGKYGSLKG